MDDGSGLSNCTAIRELYLAGNKISDVEGLHRLLKLAVLDLGFNKLTTAKALGQLVANYHSLLRLGREGETVTVAKMKSMRGPGRRRSRRMKGSRG